MLKLVKKLILDPYPLRTSVKLLIRKFQLGSYESRLTIGAIERPHYAYSVYNAAKLAAKLGYEKMSVIEFGVAGGNGLLNLEYHVEQISRLFSIDIQIFGFDTGEGLPNPLDYRDLPYQWEKGYYKMDVPSLQAKLKKAKLIIGDIKETSKDFFEKYNPAPIGMIAYDFDFYSSTVNAFRMLEVDTKYYLPRVFTYFDDIAGTEIELYNDYTGVRLAINEFNDSHKDIKFGLPYHLLSGKLIESWHHQIRLIHFFQHVNYNKFVGEKNQQLKVR